MALNKLLQGASQAITPKLDTSGSSQAFKDALMLLTQAQGVAQPQRQPGPNLESVGLALLPSLLGAGTNYLGGLAGGYMQGQNQELARQQDQAEQQRKLMLAQAQAASARADDLQRQELAQFGQESQNFRNMQDNQLAQFRFDKQQQQTEYQKQVDQMTKTWKDGLDRMAADGVLTPKEIQKLEADRASFLVVDNPLINERTLGALFNIPQEYKTLGLQRLDEQKIMNRARISDMKARKDDREFKQMMQSAKQMLDEVLIDDEVSDDEAAYLNNQMLKLAKGNADLRELLPRFSPQLGYKITIGAWGAEARQAGINLAKERLKLDKEGKQDAATIKAYNEELEAYNKRYFDPAENRSKEALKAHTKAVADFNETLSKIQAETDADKREALRKSLEVLRRVVDNRKADMDKAEAKLQEVIDNQPRMKKSDPTEAGDPEMSGAEPPPIGGTPNNAPPIRNVPKKAGPILPPVPGQATSNQKTSGGSSLTPKTTTQKKQEAKKPLSGPIGGSVVKTPGGGTAKRVGKGFR